ncbi:acyltransferase family protein [Streptomyces sp. NBC_01012]|uniref:acyltransferase family protein n=1 Tax=Streptomyces sp. NBC_01012 TaxID=2903717 RepID=UPI00386A91CD|nr:acyltransferase [Streptomyces sp. NBC_01012]
MTSTYEERPAGGAAPAEQRETVPAAEGPVHEAAERRTAASRLPSLTGLRFIAAALVFAFHAGLFGVFRDAGVQEGFQFGTSAAGFVGVSFFFVLSGFVLTWSSRTGDTAPRFWRRRFVKILPNHVVTWAVALVLIAWLGGRSVGFGPAVANLFLVHAWVPDITYAASVNDVSWSLSAEALFYLAFPALAFAASKIRPGRLWYWAGGLAATALLMPVVSQFLLPDEPQFMWGTASFTQIWFVYYSPVIRALEFALGILLARIVLTGRWVGLGVLPATALAVGAYIGALYVPFLYRFASVTALPLALLVGAVAVADIKGKRGILSSRPLVWLGEISFAFYLVHKLVLEYGRVPFGSALTPQGLMGPVWSTPGGIAFLAGALAVSVVLAWGLHVGVERPALRRWGRSRRGEESS